MSNLDELRKARNQLKKKENNSDGSSGKTTDDETTPKQLISDDTLKEIEACMEAQRQNQLKKKENNSDGSSGKTTDEETTPKRLIADDILKEIELGKPAIVIVDNGEGITFSSQYLSRPATLGVLLMYTKKFINDGLATMK